MDSAVFHCSIVCLIRSMWRAFCWVKYFLFAFPPGENSSNMKGSEFKSAISRSMLFKYSSGSLLICVLSRLNLGRRFIWIFANCSTWEKYRRSFEITWCIALKWVPTAPVPEKMSQKTPPRTCRSLTACSSWDNRFTLEPMYLTGFPAQPGAGLWSLCNWAYFLTSRKFVDKQCQRLPIWNLLIGCVNLGQWSVSCNRLN